MLQHNTCVADLLQIEGFVADCGSFGISLHSPPDAEVKTRRGSLRFLTRDKTISHTREIPLLHSQVTKRASSNDMGQNAIESATSATNLQQVYFAKYQYDRKLLLQIGRLFSKNSLCSRIICVVRVLIKVDTECRSFVFFDVLRA